MAFSHSSIRWCNLATLSKDHTRDTVTKGSKKTPYLRTENLKNHTLFRGMYLYSPYMGVPTPGKGRGFLFSLKCRTCPFLKRLKSVKWIKQHRKNRPHVEEESQKKRQRWTIADCVFVVLKHSLEILSWMDNNRKHFYCAAEKGKNVANAG